MGQLLKIGTILALAQAAVAANLDRGLLVGFLDRQLAASLPVKGAPAPQFISDVQYLSHLPVAGATQHPLQLWLAAADRMARPTHAGIADVFQSQGLAVAKLVARATTKLGGEDADGPLDRQLVGGASIVDRKPLRRVLQTLSENTKPSTLLVRGPKGSGRTRAGLFIEWYIQQQGERIYSVDASAHTPLSLLQALHRRVPRTDTVLDPSSFRPPWKFIPMAEMVANWIRERSKKEEEAGRKPRRIWLMLKHLDRAAPAQRELAAALVSKLSEGDLLLWSRLVLLAYPEGEVPRAPGADGALVHDDIDHGSITDDHLAEFLEWLYRVELRTELPSPTKATYLAQLQPPTSMVGAQRVKYIGDEADKLVARLRS